MILEILPESGEVNDSVLRDPWSRLSEDTQRFREIWYSLQIRFPRLFPVIKPGQDDDTVTEIDVSQTDQEWRSHFDEPR
ncbi:hypothetical protein A3A66_01870 [Microgenomates group bacterium RIFCSPLOWO2_01_FULL_46_13]|nr:MAG: hypothetical protein A3A66_01870 [Microgenomates group bacterium RIFCSPLOWO2_01_FULL_46_13]